jgi:hypothetical protein
VKRSHPLTLRGFLNEFSSFTSLDVRTVTLDPLASTVARSWCACIVRFTAWGPKFTICKGFGGQYNSCKTHITTNRKNIIYGHLDLIISEFWYYSYSGSKMSWSNHTQATGRRICWSYLYPQEAIVSVPPDNCRCCQWVGVSGCDFNWMKLSTARFTEKCLHPVTRSSVLLPRIEDYRIWDPFPSDTKVSDIITALSSKIKKTRAKKA